MYDDEFEEDVPASEVAEVFETLVGDLETLAKLHITKFFRGREMHYGGPIPRKVLFSPAYIKMVLDTPIADGVDHVYRLLGTEAPPSDEEITGEEVPEDIKLFISVQRLCAKAGVPKCFAAGMTLMYLELCKGFEPAVCESRRSFGRG